MDTDVVISRRRALVIAGGLSMAPFVGVALGRFGYALLLPDMRADFGWTYGQAGSLGSANAVGYLLGAVTATTAVRLTGARRLFFVSVLIAALSFALSALAPSWLALAALRLVCGVVGAWCYIVGAHLVSSLPAAPIRPDVLIGVYFGGLGLGVVASGALVPVFVERQGWPAGWWTLAGLGAGAVVLLGSTLARMPAAGEPDRPTGRPYRLRSLLAPLMLAYLLFGLGYIAYMTFAIAYVEDRGADAVVSVAQWIALGTAATAAAFLWPGLFTRMRGGRALALILAGQAGAAALLALANSTASVLVSAALFGLTLTSVAGAVTAIARTIVPTSALLRALSVLTVIFAVGQVIGPALFGWASDRVGLDAALLLSAATLAAAALCASAQVDEARTRRIPRSLRPGGHPDLKAIALMRSSMFAGLSGREIRWLSRGADCMTFPAGTHIDTVGSHVPFVYVVLDGTVACLAAERLHGHPGQHLLVALTDAQVLVLDRRYLDTLDQFVPGLRESVSVAGTIGARPVQSPRPVDRAS